jgi:hypothetical protein
VHRIDADDVIEFVNDEWLAFAEENWNAEDAARVVGTSFWDHIMGLDVRELYRTLLRRLRETGGVATLPYRCDSPDTIRRFELEMRWLSGGKIRFTSTIAEEAPREPVVLLDQWQLRSNELIVMCSWCKRVRTNGWVEPAEAVRELALFEEPPLPRISHGICPACKQATLAAAR